MREFVQAELQIFFDPGAPAEPLGREPLRVAMAQEKGDPSAKDRPPAELVEGGISPFYVHHLALVQRFYLDHLRIPRDRFWFAELDERERASYDRVHFDVQLST